MNGFAGPIVLGVALCELAVGVVNAAVELNQGGNVLSGLVVFASVAALTFLITWLPYRLEVGLGRRYLTRVFEAWEGSNESMV
jgi:hypothetical protein